MMRVLIIDYTIDQYVIGGPGGQCGERDVWGESRRKII